MNENICQYVKSIVHDTRNLGLGKRNTYRVAMICTPPTSTYSVAKICTM